MNSFLIPNISKPDEENLCFFCEKVVIDRHQLYPLEPQVEYVIFCAAMRNKQILLFCQNSLNSDTGDAEIKFGWNCITELSISKLGFNEELKFKLNKNKCGFETCTLVIYRMDFERLFPLIYHIYLYILRRRFSFNSDHIVKHVVTLSLTEDSELTKEDLETSSEKGETDDENFDEFERSLYEFNEHLKDLFEAESEMEKQKEKEKETEKEKEKDKEKEKEKEKEAEELETPTSNYQDECYRINKCFFAFVIVAMIIQMIFYLFFAD